MRKTNKKGFTIVELVIAILASVLIPTFAGVIGDASDSAAAANAKSVYTEYVAAQAKANKDAEQDLVIIVNVNNANRYFAVINGQLQDEVTTGADDAAKLAAAQELVAGDLADGKKYENTPVDGYTNIFTVAQVAAA